MDDLRDNISRIDRDVLGYKPDLLIWQIGTNDVVWRGIADNAKEMLTSAVKRMKAAKTDVVLLDLRAHGKNYCGRCGRRASRCPSTLPSDEARTRRGGNGAGLVGRSA